MAVINLTSIDESAPVLFLTEAEINRLSTEPNATAKVRAGSATAKARILISSGENCASTGLLEVLGLPTSSPIRLREETPGCLQAGPLIGILTSRTRNHRLPPYSAQNKLLFNFLSYCRKTNCLAFVFSPGGVDMQQRCVTGHYLAQNAERTFEWRTHTFPLPDIVYDRILFRSIERKQSTRQVREFLAKESNIKYFNPKFLNKWETHRILCKNQMLRRHLPETVKYNGAATLNQFLANHGTVYVKPINGSLGAGIVRISPFPGGFSYQYRSGKQTISRTCSTAEQLWTELNNKIINSEKTYIIQRGLNLIKYQQRIFDIRVLLQKNGQGQWITSAMVARVALEGNIFPNVAAGGEAKSLDAIWKDLTLQDWSSSDIRAQVTQVCLTAAETLENSLGTFAEVGLDIGIDAHGNVWIIEINSKPSYKVFPKDQQNLKKNSIKQPINFSAYMAGFATEQAQELDQN